MSEPLALVRAARDPASRERARRALDELGERARMLAPTERRLAWAAIEEARRELEDEAARAIDDEVRAIASGAARGAALLASLRALTEHRLDDAPHYGDEPLDAHLEALLDTHHRFDGLSAERAEMIHYDPSPASATLALAERGWFDAGEVFVDLGSGTGRVVVLASLLGEARCVGLEIDATLVEVSRVAALRLGAPRVEIRHGDAREVPLEDGTRFFFFAPFVGSVLAAVLGRLRGLARERAIHVGSWGPTTALLGAERWLVPTQQAPYGPFDLATFHAGPETA